MQYQLKTNLLVIKTVQWKGTVRSMNEICAIVPENVYSNPIPQESLLLRDAIGDKICPLRSWVINDGIRIFILSNELFNHLFKEVE